MQKIAKRVYSTLSKGNPMDAISQEICLYGIDIFLYTLFSTAGLLMIGWAFHRLLEAAIIIALFYLNQTFGGGYHATSHLRCFCVMAVPLVLCLLAITIPVPTWTLAMFGIFASVVLYLFPLRLHQNKSYLAGKASFFISRYRCILIVELLGALPVCVLAQREYAAAYIAGMIVSTVSRVVGVSQDKLSKREK